MKVRGLQTGKTNGPDQTIKTDGCAGVEEDPNLPKLLLVRPDKAERDGAMIVCNIFR